MSYCPKCGSKVREGMNFCPKCGVSLKIVQPPAEAAPPTPPPTPYRAEKAEKREKEEKGEKGERREEREKEEKREMREFAYVAPLIGGLFLIFVGLIFYFVVTTSFRWEVAGALFFIIIGIMIIVGVAYGVMMAARRHPKT